MNECRGKNLKRQRQAMPRAKVWEKNAWEKYPSCLAEHRLGHNHHHLRTPQASPSSQIFHVVTEENLSFLYAALILLTICYALGSLVARAFVSLIMRRLGNAERVPRRTPSFTTR